MQGIRTARPDRAIDWGRKERAVPMSPSRSVRIAAPVRRALPWRHALSGLAVACTLLLSGSARAQSPEDRAYIALSATSGTDIGTQGGKLDERRQLELRLPLPPVFLGKNILLPSIGYESRWLGLEPRGPVANVDEDVLGRHYHRIQLGLSLIRPLPPRWLLVLGATSATRTDFRGPFDLGMNTSWVGYAMASYSLGGDPGKRLTFGLVAMWPFDVTPVIPLVGFSYRKGPYIVDLGVPRLALMRKFGEGVELGVTGIFEQQVFHTRFPSAAQPLGAQYVRETALRFGPAANFRLGGGSLWLNASAGLDFLNDYAFLDKNRDPLENLRLGSTRADPYARVALSWRPVRR
jgi:hypothetical protein